MVLLAAAGEDVGGLESLGVAIEVRCRGGRRVAGERYGATVLTVDMEE